MARFVVANYLGKVFFRNKTLAKPFVELAALTLRANKNRLANGISGNIYTQSRRWASSDGGFFVCSVEPTALAFVYQLPQRKTIVSCIS